MIRLNLNNIPERKRKKLENCTVKDLQDNLYDIMQYITDDGFKAPNIERDIAELNTKAIMIKIRKYYDKNKRLKPQYKHIAGYLKYIVAAVNDIELKKQLDKQKRK